MGHAKLTDQDHSASWPEYLRKVNKKMNQPEGEAPILVEMNKKGAERQLENLVASHEISKILDSYDEQFAELQLSLNAHLYMANESIQQNSIKKILNEHYGNKPAWRLGAWVYYPWNQQLLHILDENNFTVLRTIRNRDIITAEEQETLYKYSVACLGMSVGSASALGLILNGISKQIKIADGAVISGSNLNRVLTGISDIGSEKTLAIAHRLYEMNPYAEVKRFGKIDAKSLDDLFEKPWPIKAVVDEIDDLEIKIRLRLEAKKRRIPVFMVTELADSAMLDVERYDINPDLPLFHGLVPGVEKLLNKSDMTHQEWMKHAASIIVPKNMPLNLQHSLLKVGSTIVTRPIMGPTVMVTGGITAYAVRQVALGKPMPSGRTKVALDQILVPDYRKLSHRVKHRRHTRIIKKALDAM